jgi:ATP-binding cassette subfamily B protein
MGRRRLTLEQFEAGFTGVAIMLEPGPQFKKETPKRTFTLWSYTQSLLSMRGVVAQIIGISLVLQLLGLAAPLFTAIVIDDVIANRNLNLWRNDRW